MPHILTLFALISIISPILPQQYLPKERGYLPMCDLYAINIARSGDTDFWKVDANGWTTVSSAYPVRPNAITKVTFKLINGDHFMFGVGTAQFNSVLGSQFVGQFGNSVSYHNHNGMKYKFGDGDSYGSTAGPGDNITMIVDLRAYKNTVSFEKNGLSMGIAYGGLNVWGADIYIMFSIYYGYRVSITDYQVIE